MLDHLSVVWELRWKHSLNQTPKSYVGTEEFSLVPTVPTSNQVLTLSSSISDNRFGTICTSYLFMRLFDNDVSIFRKSKNWKYIY